MNKRENLDLRVSILGSTGSIGTQALEVIDDLKGIKNIHVIGISGNKNIRLFGGAGQKKYHQSWLLFRMRMTRNN